MSQGVVYFIDSFAFGGAEQVLLGLLRGVDRRRWHPMLVHYSAPNIEALQEGAQQLGLPVYSVPWRQGLGAIDWIWTFARFLRAMQPAVFHAHQNEPLACKYALLAARLAQVPAIIATLHLSPDQPPSLSRLAQQAMLAGVVDRIIAVSYDMATGLREALPFAANKVQVIHNGIDFACFESATSSSPRRSLLPAVEGVLVVSVGRLDHQKGYAYLLEAIVHVANATFVLIGDGPERARLEAYAQQLRIDHRVVFLGRRPDVPDWLARCDLFVLPSLFEGLPLSILEAMAAGKPVVASAVGGIREAVVHGQTGILMPPANPVALAAAIRTIATSPALGRYLGTMGKARVQRLFSEETMVARTMQLYDDILVQKRA